MERNHYRVLLVAPDASIEEIERSFRQLARRLHPDLNGGDGANEEKMKELNVARATLTDAAARSAYDEKLRREQRAKAPPPPAPPAPLARPAGGRGAQPLVSWMRAREVKPPPPTSELGGRAADVSRLFWLTISALTGLVVVIGMILLGRAVNGGP